MPYRNGTIVPNATVWTEEMKTFLTDNFFKMTNAQLAKALGLRLTVTRNKCSELGLRRMEMEYWTAEQVQYLRDNYKTKGNVELAEYFEKTWPKKKRWRKQHINKKRKYLDLHRTKKQQEVIIAKNSAPGGRSYTIDKNSSSTNMHPTWVAQQLAWRDKDAQKQLLQMPEIIDAGREWIKLKRAIKKAGNDRQG